MYIVYIKYVHIINKQYTHSHSLFSKISEPLIAS